MFESGNWNILSSRADYQATSDDGTPGPSTAWDRGPGEDKLSGISYVLGMAVDTPVGKSEDFRVDDPSDLATKDNFGNKGIAPFLKNMYTHGYPVSVCLTTTEPTMFR